MLSLKGKIHAYYRRKIVQINNIKLHVFLYNITFLLQYVLCTLILLEPTREYNNELRIHICIMYIVY